MQITGKTLLLLQSALTHAIYNVHTEIVTCPDIFMYEKELEELDKEHKQYKILLDRVTKSISKEG